MDFLKSRVYCIVYFFQFLWTNDELTLLPLGFVTLFTITAGLKNIPCSVGMVLRVH